MPLPESYIPSLPLDELRRIALCDEPVTCAHLDRAISFIDDSDSEYMKAASEAQDNEHWARNREHKAENERDEARAALNRAKDAVKKAVAALGESTAMLPPDHRIDAALEALAVVGVLAP